MKIGIITFHRTSNYGAVLQCYSLQEVLKSLGHDTMIIDYRQPHIDKICSPFSLQYFAELLMHPRGLYMYIKQMPRRVNRKKIFSEFRLKWFRMSESCDKQSIPQDIDCYVVGSDQLWGLHCTGGDKDPVYFGTFKRPKSSKIIGYAISTNQKSIDQICADELKKYTSNFSSLSFREALIADAVFRKSGSVSHIDIDPTLLTNESTWKSMVNDKWAKEKYIILYQLRRLKDDEDLLNRKAEELAMQLNCKVIDIYNMDYSVEDFVSLFKYAQCVITSSFHASVFSIIFERPLQVVMLKDGQDGRYENILKAIGAEEFLVDIDFIPKIVNVEYRLIKKNLEELRLKSLDYLKKNIID